MRKSIRSTGRTAGHALAVAIVSLVATACVGSETSSMDCSDELQIEGEAMQMEQNIEYSIGDSEYVVANLGPREVDGVVKRGAQLMGGEAGVTFFDCEVVEIEGVEYRARIESTSVLFEPLST